jgi:phage terminase large subunit-like protein
MAKLPSRRADPVTRYAMEVVDGRVVACRFVRLACERHLRDLETGKKRRIWFHPDQARYAIEFFGYLNHSKGEWAGQPIILQPWQEFAVGSIFGWKKTNGFRGFRAAYSEVARKNGKSTALAGVGVYCLVADREPGGEVYCAATKKDQARIIFGEAQRMVRASPELRSKVSVFKLNMSVDSTSSKFEPLSSDERTLDGLNPSCVLIDELHKHRSRALIDVMNTALGARRQPIMWEITTASDDNPETAYAQERDYAVKVLEGVVEDDSLFALIYTLDPGDRWDDPDVWVKANPNLGVSVYREELQQQAIKARNSPAALASFLRLRLNVQTSSTNRAIDMEVWRRNGRGRIDHAKLAGRRFFGGLDLSSKLDISAFVKLFEPAEEDDGIWTILARFWMPADTIAEASDRDRVQYQRWVEAGYIEPTPGNVIDHAEIQAEIEEDCRLYEPASIAFDPWNASQISTALLNEGVPMVEFIQGIRSYNAPTKELDALLLAGKLDHGDNPVLAWMAHNLHVTKPDRNDNVMPSKKHSISRIDGMTALIMAIGRSMTDEPLPYSDGRDLRVI